MPESEGTSTAANHSFPANTSRNSETRGKRKSGKSQALSQLMALEERKLNNWRRLCNRNRLLSTQEDEDYNFLMSLLPHLRDIPKRRKLAVRLALQQVLIEEGSGESDRTERSSGSSYYSNSTVPTPSSSYGMQSSESEHTPRYLYNSTISIRAAC